MHVKLQSDLNQIFDRLQYYDVITNPFYDGHRNIAANIKDMDSIKTGELSILVKNILFVFFIKTFEY